MKLSLVMCAVAILAVGCSGEDGNNMPTAPSSNVQFSTTDLRVGTGATATTGRAASVRYTGWIYSSSGTDNKGTQFDSGSFSFTVGSGVIQGFSMGVNGMQVGGIRRIVIPPNLGYGNNPPPNSGIRANETLIFEVELLAVQ
ncbi:MAG TPA: FKBP-type peptidyl-prolyl cis-trans isomerase [Vicinamibacterales bacterium]|nr:FKBP-type peptidyl-prolyl cis-trans isomerase [Vicinamibacterales bacterium]